MHFQSSHHHPHNTDDVSNQSTLHTLHQSRPPLSPAHPITSLSAPLLTYLHANHTWTYTHAHTHTYTDTFTQMLRHTQTYTHTYRLSLYLITYWSIMCCPSFGFYPECENWLIIASYSLGHNGILPLPLLPLTGHQFDAPWVCVCPVLPGPIDILMLNVLPLF